MRSSVLSNTLSVPSFIFRVRTVVFFCHVTLNLDIRILLPASYVFRHFKLDLFLKELVHLPFNRIRLALSYECTGVINTRHLIEIFVRSSKAAHHVELSVENVFPMASIMNSIIYDQLNHHFFCFLAME